VLLPPLSFPLTRNPDTAQKGTPNHRDYKKARENKKDFIYRPCSPAIASLAALSPAKIAPSEKKATE
jgi:hypothetical protein